MNISIADRRTWTEQDVVSRRAKPGFAFDILGLLRQTFLQPNNSFRNEAKFPHEASNLSSRVR